MQLAMAASCSQRHISFLELGRTKPSREMVLRLSEALDVPLRQSNELLLAAGFAPNWAGQDIMKPRISRTDGTISRTAPTHSGTRRNWPCTERRQR